MTKAEKLLAKGRGLEKKGKQDKALEVYRDACRAEPYDPELWTARAEAAARPPRRSHTMRERKVDMIPGNTPRAPLSLARSGSDAAARRTKSPADKRSPADPVRPAGESVVSSVRQLAGSDSVCHREEPADAGDAAIHLAGSPRAARAALAMTRQIESPPARAMNTRRAFAWLDAWTAAKGGLLPRHRRARGPDEGCD